MQTRKFPHTIQEAFPETVEAIERRKTWEWFEGHRPVRSGESEFWVYIVMAFAAGFVTHLLWG